MSRQIHACPRSLQMMTTSRKWDTRWLNRLVSCGEGGNKEGLPEEGMVELRSMCEKAAAKQTSEGSVVPPWAVASAKALRQK